jgi:hypothetical protein
MAYYFMIFSQKSLYKFLPDLAVSSEDGKIFRYKESPYKEISLKTILLFKFWFQFFKCYCLFRVLHSPRISPQLA